MEGAPTPSQLGPPGYLIRLSQAHEAFRVAELQALAEVEQIPLTITSYASDSPILLITGPRTPADASRLVRRAILVQGIYEHWGSGATLDALHASVRATSAHLWAAHSTATWKFNIDAFQGGGGAARTPAQRNALINTFRYLPLTGPISLKSPELELCIFELYSPSDPHTPHTYHFGRYLGVGARDLPAKYDLKTRPYISTTSMAADLALLTANIALAAPGKLFYDPFVGTGSFPLACAAFGATAYGSDIDGRAVRGSGNDARAKHQQGRIKGEKTLRGNFVHYGTQGRLGDVFAGDLTHSPLRKVAFGSAGAQGRRRLLDGVVCDPPYGVREGLRVLGCRDPEGMPWVVEAGHTRYKDPAFIPPKKPYSFDAMLCDILHFASETLVDDGRLAFWMPTANSSESTTDEADAADSSPNSDSAPPPTEQSIPIPTHPCLALVTVCIQPFNRWSRRLLTYRKLPDEQVDIKELEAWLTAQQAALLAVQEGGDVGADELNPFRKGYFSKFAKETPTPPEA